ncbi:hypothetical protein BSZ39_07425 [Bowdeniella nasicola]|uniref:Protein kinase domain-containing protein n=1 Tax=Bowdeniella nasicola TaxID=208480 RepID=A0A1Q5Q2E1_9ACTO|nr:serine/threonine-protein kinase [Bowdeniella nasicola]OKL53832.1 hypothetical protein BSZ39_07425 [Bowdeniella nasicola]
MEGFGGYYLGEQIGSGGMGRVYRAIDADGRDVAVKILHPAISADPKARARLAREVATLHRVRGAGVAQVLDAEVDDTDAFIVTELVDGPTLHDDVETWGAYDAAELAGLASGLKRALEQIHAAGVVHRDLKPSNVMMDASGPVLIDFGIAQVADDARFTATGLVTGTAGFLDPQALAGKDPSPAGDWWSWAAVLCFAGTARPPFGTGPAQGIIARLHSERPDTAGLPANVAEILTAALAVEPEDRPNPSEVLTEIYAAANRGDEVDPKSAEGPRQVLLTEHLQAAKAEVENQTEPPTTRLASEPMTDVLDAPLVSEEQPPPPPVTPPQWEPATQVLSQQPLDATRQLPVIPEAQPEQAYPDYGQPVDPYAMPAEPYGPVAQPAVPRGPVPYPWTSLTILAALSALSLRWPGWVLVGVLVAMFLTGVVGQGQRSLQWSRWRYGPRPSDPVRVVTRGLWHSLGHALATVWYLILSGVVMSISYLIASPDISTTGFNGLKGGTPPVAAAATMAVIITVLWWQPSYAAGREATRRLISLTFPGFYSRAVFSLALLGLSAVLLLVTLGTPTLAQWNPLSSIDSWFTSLIAR